MPAAASAAPILNRIAELTREVVNSPNFFVGCKLEESFVAENVVIFKRTSPEMLRPRGVTHNYHHRFVLICPLAKSGRVHVDGIAYLIEPGQAFLIFPHQFHHFLDIHEGGIDWLFVTFEGRNPAQIATLRNSPRVLGAPEAESLERMMAQHLSMPPGPDRSFALIVHLSQLVRRLRDAREADCIGKAESPIDDPRGTLLQKINAYVRSHLSKPLQISDIARHTGYSTSYVRAVFRKEFQVSLGNYVRDSRLSVAAAILSKPDHDSVESIAKACGFESIYVFSRAFKKATGLSPRAYNSFVLETRNGGA